MSYDGGDGRQLWQRWTIETAFNGGGGGVVDNICLFNSKELGGSFSQNAGLAFHSYSSAVGAALIKKN